MEEIMRMVAIGNLSMLAQIASREIEAKPGEVEEREAWLVRYLETGEGLVTPEAEAMARRVREALRGASGAETAVTAGDEGRIEEEGGAVWTA